MRGLLDDYCRKTPVRGGKGSHHAGSAAPDHDDVVLLRCHVEHVIELPGLGATGPVTRTRGLREMLSVAIRDELAADLAQAERSREPIAPLTAAYPDIDVVDAYEIQLINIRQRVAEGARVLGHKVGLSSQGDAADDGRRRAGLWPSARRDAGVRRHPGQGGPLPVSAGRGRSGFHPGRRTCREPAAPRTTCWRPPRPWSRRSS